MEIVFPYGTQYYRPPNPPEADWERDLQRIADTGFNTVKIWAMWSWIHRKEGNFEFEPLDKLLTLAHRYNLRIIINTILENAPYWLIERSPEFMYEASDGQRFQPIARPNTPTGGWPGLCLDNPPVREVASEFLAAIGKRYATNSTLWGYDVWNEVFFEPVNYHGFEGRHFCYCAGTRAKYTQWLQSRYGSLESLCEAWRRPYTAWSQVYPPRYRGGYPDWIDWLKFRIESMSEQMQWRVETLRKADPNHSLTSHGIAYTLHGMPTHLTNDFLVAPLVEKWGLSTFPVGDRDASNHWRQLDLVRSASYGAGREFWQNELQGGATADGLTRGPVITGSDIEFWNWTALACGIKGLMYWQWRQELLGEESPGFGLTTADGSLTDRTAAAGRMARFLQKHPGLAEARPVRGELAIVVLPESQLLTFAAQGSTEWYAQCLFGVYKALWQAGYQVDFVPPSRLAEYPVVWLPFPVAVEKENADLLKAYVAGGGMLISDAMPGQYGNHGVTSPRVPGSGLQEMFGCVEAAATFELKGPLLRGSGRPEDKLDFPTAIYREILEPASGEAVAFFEDGTPAVVDNTFGKGRTRLIGTMPGASFLLNESAEAAAYIVHCAREFGVAPLVSVEPATVKVRLHRGSTWDYLYIVNAAETPEQCTIRSRYGLQPPPKVEAMIDGTTLLERAESEISLALEARSGTVLRLSKQYT